MLRQTNGGREANATHFVTFTAEPQGASRGFLAGKRIPQTPVASAMPLKVSTIGREARGRAAIRIETHSERQRKYCSLLELGTCNGYNVSSFAEFSRSNVRDKPPFIASRSITSVYKGKEASTRSCGKGRNSSPRMHCTHTTQFAPTNKHTLRVRLCCWICSPSSLVLRP